MTIAPSTSWVRPLPSGFRAQSDHWESELSVVMSNQGPASDRVPARLGGAAVSTAEAEIVAGGGSVEVGRGVRVAIATGAWVGVCAAEGWDGVTTSGRVTQGAVQAARVAASSTSARAKRRLLTVSRMTEIIGQGMVNEPMISPNGNGVRVPSRAR